VIVERTNLPGAGYAVCYSPETDRFYSIGYDAYDACGLDGVTDRPVMFISDDFALSGMGLLSGLNKLYCLDQDLGQIAAVDLVRGAIAANNLIGVGFTEVISACVSESTRKLYVSSNDDTLRVYDCVSDTLFARIGISALDPLLCSAERAGAVVAATGHEAVIVDCSKDSVMGTIDLYAWNPRLYPDPSGQWVYVVFARWISRIDPAAMTITPRFEIGPAPVGFCVAPRLGRLYIADSTRDCVQVLTLAADSLVARIELPGKPYGLCYDSLDDQLYVACAPGDTVWIVDCTKSAVVGRVPNAATRAQSSLVYHADGNRVFAVYRDSLSVIDCGERRVTERIGCEGVPLHMPLLCDGLDLVVCDGSWNRSRLALIRDDRPVHLGVISASGPGQATVARGTLYLTGHNPGLLYDLSGRLTATLVPGDNDVSRLAPGVYFVRAVSREPSAVSCRKVVLTK
jgi:DNA-binding beta-propeller fold protein YncE